MELVFRNAKGVRLRESIFPQFPDVSAETFPRKLQSLAPEVTTSTCSPHWTGESCDYSMVVEGLLRRDGKLMPLA
jgi:hypothetical protein